MSSNPPVRRIYFAAMTLLALSLASACATSPRPEPAGSAAPVNAASERPQPGFAAPPPATEASEDAAKGTEMGGASTPLPQAVQPHERMRSASKPSGGAPAPARSPSMDTDSPSPKKSKAESKSVGAQESGADLLAGRDDGADPLLPSVRDASDLRIALQDWQNAAVQLTSSRGCEDGCRAFQSMQRAAARICNLVINQDPALRCATAKSRVEDAQRNISRRCGKCER